MNSAPKIAIILCADGTMDDVFVLAKDQEARVFGFRVIEALTEEVEVFEARAKARIAQLSKIQ